jgi:chaperonin cofactor prefoldin
MALSPADFYAYSRATGAPIPEDPQERADMAPEVLEFRRNQLKAPQQESNPLNALGAAALGLGALAGLGFGARRLMRREPTIPQGPRKSATAGVRQVDLADLQGAVRRVAAEPAPSTPPPASKIASRSVMPTDEEAFEQYTRQLRSQIPQPTAEELNFPSAASRTYGVNYREGQTEPGYRSAALAAFEKRYPPSPEVQAARRATAQQDLLDASLRLQTGDASLTDIQKAQTPVNADQFINAVESGEDQTTGRVIKQINVADPWGQATVPPDAVSSQQSVLALPPAATSPQEQAQQFLQSKFEELGALIPGRYRRERAMGQDPAIAEAMELYASTGDPAVLSRLSETPSSPLTISPRVQMEVNQDAIPTGKFYQVTPYGESTDTLVEKDINLTNRISSLGEQKQNIINRLEEIDALEPQIRFAAADEPGRGGYYTSMLNKMLFEKQSLPDPNSFNADIGDALVERSLVRAHQESLESLGPKYKPLNRQEGVRPFFEVDPVTGEPIAETLEIRSGRPTLDTERKGGGGRNVGEFVAGGGNPLAEAVEEVLQGGRKTRVRDFDIETGNLPQMFEEDRSQTGRSIGIYGIEPRNRPIADPELRPTVLQREETKGLKLRQEPNRSTPEAKRRSLEVSEALRRATIEGRDPQSILKQFGIGI